MNRAQTYIQNECVFVSVTIDGNELYAKLVPRSRLVTQVAAEDVLPHMRIKPAEQNVQAQQSVAIPAKPEEQPKLGIGATISGAAKLLTTHLGIDAADESVVANRTRLCKACPKNDLGRCTSCGCYLWAKVRKAKESCPLRKW